MKITMIEPQTSKSPKHFFIWGDEMSALYKDDSITHVAQQFGDIIRVVKIDVLLRAPYEIRVASTFRPYFQWLLSDIEFTIIN